MIRDQRHLSGPRLLTTPQEVKDSWRSHAESMLADRGVMFLERQSARGFARSKATLQPHVSLGRWCADCPRCNGGIALWREHDQACCLDCGTIYTKIAWPPEKDHRELEREMGKMPDPNLRNWNPGYDGETIKQAIRRFQTELPPKPEEVVVAAAEPADPRRGLGVSSS